MGANPFALILSAIIIAAAVIGTQFISRYQIVAAGGEGNVVAWRLDIRTGEVDRCAVSKKPLSQSDKDPFKQFDTDAQIFNIECKQDFSAKDSKP
ncbi:MAG TPA: hypothetical protein VN952_04300 [Chthoniobacterales bacterium]|nr:hypothetical protein [Chthoniobacterales bacterium]